MFGWTVLINRSKRGTQLDNVCRKWIIDRKYIIAYNNSKTPIDDAIRITRKVYKYRYN